MLHTAWDRRLPNLKDPLNGLGQSELHKSFLSVASLHIVNEASIRELRTNVNNN